MDDLARTAEAGEILNVQKVDVAGFAGDEGKMLQRQRGLRRHDKYPARAEVFVVGIERLLVARGEDTEDRRQVTRHLDDALLNVRRRIVGVRIGVPGNEKQIAAGIRNPCAGHPDRGQEHAGRGAGEPVIQLVGR